MLDGLYVLTLGLILGVPLAPVAGLWAMITNLIPQIGGFLGGSFFVLLAFSAGPLTGLLALVGFVAYMNFENNVIQPAIIGQSMNLSPPTTMVAALIGGAVAGVPGALAVTPLVGTAKAIVRSLRGEPLEPPKPRLAVARQAQVVRAPAQRPQGRRDVLSRCVAESLAVSRGRRRQRAQREVAGAAAEVAALVADGLPPAGQDLDELVEVAAERGRRPA